MSLAPAEDPMIPRRFRIASVCRENGSGEVYSWALDPVEGGPLEFRPGQFNMLYHYGVGEVPISISGDPADSGTLVHTIRAVGTVTRAMQAMQPGDEVGVRGPFGSAWPVEAAYGKDLLVITGGIGMAPLRPVMYEALRNRDQFNRVFLFYGTREPQDILFREEIEEWRSHLDLEIEVTVDRATPGWAGNIGVVTKLIERGGFDPANAVAMMCGPEIMMRFAVLALQKKGVADSDIYVSMERNMKCAVGYCGHCQYGPYFICKDGPVFPFDKVEPFFRISEF